MNTNTNTEQARKIFAMLPNVVASFSEEGRVYRHAMKQRLTFLGGLVADGFEQWYRDAPDDRCPVSGDWVYLCHFETERELREYVISGMCKKVQDASFVSV